MSDYTVISTTYQTRDTSYSLISHLESHWFQYNLSWELFALILHSA